MYLPNIRRNWASRAGSEPKTMSVTGKKIHWQNTNARLRSLSHQTMSFGMGGNRMVLNTADTNMPSMEMVIMRLVKMGKLNDRTVKLNCFPPSKMGSQPNRNSNRAAVAHDQKPSTIV